MIHITKLAIESTALVAVKRHTRDVIIYPTCLQRGLIRIPNRPAIFSSQRTLERTFSTQSDQVMMHNISDDIKNDAYDNNNVFIFYKA